jgi:hypothetical protein
VLLQHPVEVDGVFKDGSKGTRSGKVVLLGSLSLDVLGVAVHACLSKGMLRSCQSILPRSNGIFPTVHLPLSGEELLTQLDSHH